MKSRRPQLLLAIAVLVARAALRSRRVDAAGAEAADRSRGRHRLEDARRPPCCRTTASGSAIGSRPQEGDARGRRQGACAATRTMRFPIGEQPQRRRRRRWPRRRRRRGASALAFSDDGEVGRVHDVSDARGGAAAEAAAAADPVERDGGEPRDRREEGVPEDSPLRVLGRVVRLDRAAALRPGCARRRRGGGRGGAGGGRGAARRRRRQRARTSARHRPDPARPRDRRDWSSTSATSASSRSARTASCSRSRSTRRTRRATACSCAT